jgi:DNA-binding LacI/PurR family transcriptional regulator
MKNNVKHTTIIDIAKILEISPSTVSRALNNHPDINDKTKEKVRETAKKLQYSPNTIAQSLKTNRTTTIGVMVPEIKHDFFSSAISGIEEIAYHSGYTIIVCQSNESYEREVLNTNVLIRQRIAGIIVSLSQNTKNCEHFKDLLRQRIPLVFFDRVCDDIEASKVMIDDYKSAFDAVTFLIKKGYRRIAHIAGPEGVGIYDKRLKGYVDAMRKNHVPCIDGYMIHAALHAKDGFEAMDSLFKSGSVPDAVFTVNDHAALGACKRIKEAGLKIPDDIALIGFSNDIVTSVVDPLLTTIDQFPLEMGRKAAEILIQTIENKLMKPKTIIMDTKLIVREST